MSKETPPPLDPEMKTSDDIVEEVASLSGSTEVRWFGTASPTPSAEGDLEAPPVMADPAEVPRPSAPSAEGDRKPPPLMVDPSETFRPSASIRPSESTLEPPTMVNTPADVPSGTMPRMFNPSFATPGTVRSLEGYPVVAMTPPKMGILVDHKRVKLGGEPKADWSGLAAPTRGTPMCYRYASDSNEQKNYALRTTLPSDCVFKKKCDLVDLMAVLMRHAKNHGLDSVLYVPDPDRTLKVAFVPTDYTRIDWMKIRASVARWVDFCWDQYDLDNDAAAYEMILKACDKDMRRTINPYLVTCKKELPASVLLALITSQVEHVTRLTYPSMRADLMKKTPKSFPGINIQLFNEMVMETLVKLEQSRQLTEEVMTWLIKAFIALQIDGFSNRLRDEFFDQLIRCYDLQGDATHSDMMDALREARLHWEDILARALELYRNMVSYGEWPNQASRDTKAPPASFNKVELALQGHPELVKQFQAFLAQTQKEIKCFGCGKVGFRRPDCPNCKDKKNGGGDKGKGSGKTDDRVQDRWPAPKGNEPIFKIHDNRLYIFCSKCNDGKGRWQAHHKPKDHGDKSKKLGIPELIKLRKEFHASKTIPAEFNFCLPVMSDEGISP